jgi:O-antigen/teichoic acid export membrane protein
MSVRKALGWMGLAQAGFFITQFAGSVVLARLLTPYEMGVYAIAASVVGMLSLIQTLGLAEYIISQKELTPRLLSGAFTVNALMAAGLAALTALLGLLGGRLFDEPGVRTVLLVVAVIPLLGALEFRPTAMMKREGRFKRLALLGMARHLVATAATVGLAFAGFSFMSLAYGQLLGTLAAVLFVSLGARRHVSLAVSLAHWRELVRFGADILSINGLSNLAGRAQELSLGKLEGLDALGLYGRALNLFNLLWNNIHVALASVVMVDFSEELRQGRTLAGRYKSAVTLMTGALWPAFLMLAVLSGPLIHLIYGERWTAAAIPLSLLCLAALPLLAAALAWEVFLVQRETRVQIRIEVIRNVIGFALFVGGAMISLEAAAAARLLDGVFAYLLYRPHLERLTATRFSDFLPIYASSGAASLAAVGPAIGLMVWAHWRSDVEAWALLAALAAGGVLWLLALKLLRHPLLDEGVAMLRARIAR